MPPPHQKRAGHSASERIREFFRKKSDDNRNIQVSDLLKVENENILKDIIEKVLESQKVSSISEPTVLPLYNSASTQTDNPTEDEATAPNETVGTVYNSSSTQTIEDVKETIKVADQAVQVAMDAESETNNIDGDDGSESDYAATSSHASEETQLSTHNKAATEKEHAPQHYRYPSPEPKPKVIRIGNRVKVPWRGKYIVVCLPPNTERRQATSISARNKLNPFLAAGGRLEDESWKQNPGFHPEMYKGAVFHFGMQEERDVQSKDIAGSS